MKPYLNSFFRGFLQVFMVSISTWTIANKVPVLIFLSSFGISFLWASNVKKISISSKVHQFLYALGAACGSLSGFFLMEIIFTK